MVGSYSLWSAATKIAGVIGGGAICAAMVWVGITSEPLAERTADFRVECFVLDETGEVERTEFESNERVILALLMDVPEGVYQGQMDVKVFASVEADGFKYRVRLPQVIGFAPERSERFAIDGYTPDLQEFTPFRELDTRDELDFYEEVPFDLPFSVPNSTFTLSAVGTIKGYGSQTCEKEVHLVN